MKIGGMYLQRIDLELPNEEKSISFSQAASPNLSIDRQGQVAKSRSLINAKQNGHVCHSPKCRKKLLSSSNNAAKNSSIQIVQEGDDIRICIDGNIEILTNRFNDRKVISLSPNIVKKSLAPTNLKKSELVVRLLLS